jgi:hypothetical protein
VPADTHGFRIAIEIAKHRRDIVQRHTLRQIERHRLIGAEPNGLMMRFSSS